jgi:hypothetical protein
MSYSFLGLSGVYGLGLLTLLSKQKGLIATYFLLLFIATLGMIVITVYHYLVVLSDFYFNSVCASYFKLIFSRDTTSSLASDYNVDAAYINSIDPSFIDIATASAPQVVALRNQMCSIVKHAFRTALWVYCGVQFLWHFFILYETRAYIKYLTSLNRQYLETSNEHIH